MELLSNNIFFATGSVLYSLNIPNIYKADALLAPSEDSNDGGLLKVKSQLGGFAALAGVSLGGSQSYYSSY